LECLVRADNRDSIVNAVEKGLQILFDVRKSVIFLYYAENNILAGAAVKGGPREGLINSLEIPIQSMNSLLVRSLKSDRILDSYSPDLPLTIADEQLIRLLGAAGIVCLPMTAHKNMVGVIAVSADPHEARQLRDQAKPLRLLAGHAAISFHLHEVKRNQAKKLEIERQEASSAMARMVIHEVNNPLGIIKNYIKIIERKLEDDSQAQDELRIVNEEIDRVGQIIRQLTSFSSPSQGKYEDFDLNALIDDILKVLHKSLLRPANLKTHFKPDDYLPTIKCNKNSLVQILINLIKNAAEAMSREGNIYMETRHVDFYGNKLGKEEMNNPSWVQIVIRDDGPGIPDKIKDRMFEPANTTKGEGHYGLGLSIVYNIVRDLKGLIDWKSEKEAGTVFTIQLPMTLRNNGKGSGGTDEQDL
jgi:nitrogen-specific signal transduction histidine kinase